MPPIVLTNDDVIRMITPTEAVAVMEDAFRARARGSTVGEPRWHLPFGKNTMTFTVGGVHDSVGFRTYLRGNLQRDDQLVAVWHRRSGRLRGIILGELLGDMRTGAIGAAAVKHLARANSTSLAMIGTGRQAYTQLRAILTTPLPIDEVRVFSRDAENRKAFSDDFKEILPNLDIFPVESAEMAIRNADIVIGATNSETPVIRGEWLKAGAHVTTVGPKFAKERETDEVVVERADLIVTDSPEQARAFPNGFVANNTSKLVHDLADVVSGRTKRPSDDTITFFVSTGLAGTEVALASHLLDKIEKDTRTDPDEDMDIVTPHTGGPPVVFGW
jgi:ornithine cyclodeaminase